MNINQEFQLTVHVGQKIQPTLNNNHIHLNLAELYEVLGKILELFNLISACSKKFLQEIHF